MPRMKILNSVERVAFDFPPIFNSVERKRCFDFPTALQDIATSLRTASNQLGLYAQTLENSVQKSSQVSSNVTLKIFFHSIRALP